MPFDSTFAGVPDELIEKVRAAVDRLRSDEAENRSALIADAVLALELTRPHVSSENQSRLDHFVEMIMNSARALGSGH